MTKEEEYKKLRNDVYTLFYYSNKPFHTTELVLQFKGTKKSAMEKLLEDLVKKGLITEKVNGKSKIHFLNQEKLQKEIEDLGIEIEVVKEEYEKNTQALEECKNDYNNLIEKINDLSNELSNEELKSQIEYIEKRLEGYKDLKLEEDSDIITEEEFKVRKENVNKRKKVEVTRKRIYNEIVEQVSEGLGMKKKDFLEEVGL